jgi:H+/Cl- antiporter ClcA
MVCYAEGPWGVFEWWRNVADNISEGFGKLFNCMMCFSTWIGLVFSIIDLLLPSVVFTPFNLIIGESGPWWLILVLDAGLTSGGVWLIHNLEEAFERHGTVGIIDNNEED